MNDCSVSCNSQSCKNSCGNDNCYSECTGNCYTGCDGGCGSGLNFTLKEIDCFQDPHFFFIFVYLGHHNDYFLHLNNYVKGS